MANRLTTGADTGKTESLLDLCDTTPHPLRDFLKDHVTQAAMSRALGISHHQVSCIMCGYRPASPEVEAKLQRLADEIRQRRSKTSRA